MHHEVPSQGFEVELGALAENTSQLYQAARGVIDEDEERAGLATVFSVCCPMDVPLFHFPSGDARLGRNSMTGASSSTYQP